MRNEEKMESDKEGFKISCSFTRRLSSSFSLLFYFSRLFHSCCRNYKRLKWKMKNFPRLPLPPTAIQSWLHRRRRLYRSGRAQYEYSARANYETFAETTEETDKVTAIKTLTCCHIKYEWELHAKSSTSFLFYFAVQPHPSVEIGVCARTWLRSRKVSVRSQR